MVGIRGLVPHGLVRVKDWSQRFRRIGAPTFYALSPRRRQALLTCRFELLPFRHRQRVSLVVDVGANQGQWSRAIAQFLDIGRHVLVEPNPAVFKADLLPLQANLSGIELHQCALGPSDGVATLNVTQGSSLASLLPVLDEQRNWHGDFASVVETVAVPVRMLDEILSGTGRIGLLKLDVQGFEKQVIAGGMDVLSRTDCLLIEFDFESHYEGDSSYYELARLLHEDLGFRFWDMSPPERRRDGRALWTDVCFVRNTKET